MKNSKENSIYLKKFGENIRKEREKLNMSQEKLAEKANLHRTYIGGIERGERNVSLINIICIAQALNVNPIKLFENLT